MKNKLLIFALIAAVSAHAEGLTNILSFTTETKIKGPFTEVDGQLYFACEKGGALNYGYIGKFNPTAGTITPLYEFPATSTGIKAEARPVWFEGQLYYAAREGGDPTQLSGKGAGAIGTIDLKAGTVTKLVDLDAATNVAKIKTLLPFNGRLYYTGEEGGDLWLNSGKGFGGLGYYEPAHNAFSGYSSVTV